MKVLIIDDEPMPGKHLEGLIKQHCFEIETTHVINSPLLALEHLEDNHYDIIFLDVEMPRMNGFELLEKVKIPHSTQVIFTTAYSQYAVEAFKVNAAHYLLKMVKKEELINAVRKALHLIRKQKEQKKQAVISVFIGEEYMIVRQEDILRLEASGSYTKIITEKRELLSTKRLGTYEEILSKKNFARCHNSHLINIGAVEKISKGRKGYVVMRNGDVVPIVASKKDIIEKILGI